ncbi:MAG TPA: helix-turn-helix domain-containing protein [Xanthomonadaceae bacterium]
MDVASLVELAKEKSNSPSYSSLAKRLGTTSASVSNWRVGRNYPDAVTCEKIAEITGIPLARVLGIVGEARAISREEKAVWRRLASAAALMLMLLPIASRAVPSANLNDGPGYALCEMMRRICANETGLLFTSSHY